MASAELVGRQVSATFTGTEGQAIGTTMYGWITSTNMRVLLSPVDRFNDRAQRLTKTSAGTTIQLEFTFSSMVPVPPTGTSAVLTVFEDEAKTQGFTYMNAVVSHRRRMADPYGSSAQRLYLTFRVTATGVSGTDPIVPMNPVTGGGNGWLFNTPNNSAHLALTFD